MFRTGCAWAIALAGCTDGLDYSTQASHLDLDQFAIPQLSEAERADIVHAYDHLDPTDQVPRGLLEDAIIYFDHNAAVIPKSDYFVVVDFSRFSGLDRFWLVDVSTGSVEPHKVAHGDGSDPDHDGYADSFGNVEGSHKSSLGFYLTGEIYNGTHRHSMRLDGLSRAGDPNNLENDAARERLIVVHEADYVDDTSEAKQGRSNGCLALDPTIEVAMVDRIYGGSLIYAALSPLFSPVGRTPPPTEPIPGEEPPPPEEAGGCSTSSGAAGLPFALVFLGLCLRRRSR